ncbi:uncharacterized protein RAG0_11219 [Rhynchosporium agropyri]|uniref:Uncharacterized protein n=1 Tax=Rhynchosporium agropyri TaxID=914238 RepID=A0A1E1L378_9HELO|nr:uncharacterized protein RAG0_11219 [Rhynchosporium agropyri]
MVINHLFNFQDNLGTHMILRSHNDMLVAAIFLFFVALAFVLATRRIPSLHPWTRCWQQTSIRTTRQRPCDAEAKILQDVKPYQFPALKERTHSKVTMGLKRLDESNWLTLDSNYLPEHAIRQGLLSTCRANVIECLPGSEAACHEVLNIVASFLSTRFPQHFAIISSPSGPKIINHLTDEVYPIGQSCPNPLEVAAKLSMEDFNILLKHPETGEYHLQASATLFPAGWKLQERIGTTMANLHKPVPGWKNNFGGSVNRYFDHLSHKTAMERTNVFIQTTPDLFQDAPPSPDEHGNMPKTVLTLDDLKIRRERQTFTRLQHTGAVLFTVRTFMEPLSQLGDDELKALRTQVLGWDQEVRTYKGGDIWGPLLMQYCEGRIGAVEVKVDC